MGQSVDVASLHAAELFSPLGSLGHAVGLAQDVLLPLVEALALVLDEPVIVSILGDPDPSNSFGHGAVGSGIGSQPLVAPGSSGVVAPGIDEDHLHAQFLTPPAPTAAVLAVVTTGGGVGVDGPHDQQVGVLQSLFQHVEVVGDAQLPVVAPSVGSTPVPAFPGVGVIAQLRVAQHVPETAEGTHLVLQQTEVGVRTGGAGDGSLAVGGVDALDLALQQIESLVPGDALIAGLTTVLNVALAVGIEVNTLHGVLDAVLGVDTGLHGAHVVTQRHLAGGSKGLAAGLDGPGLSVGIVKNDGSHLSDLAVLHVDKHGTTNGAVSEDLLAFFQDNTLVHSLIAHKNCFSSLI